MSIIGWTPSQTHFQLGHRTRWFPMTQSSELVASILSGTSIIRRSSTSIISPNTSCSLRYPRLTIRHLMYKPLPYVPLMILSSLLYLQWKILPIPKCIHLYVYVSSTPSCILSGWRPNYRAPRQSFHGGQWERIQRFRFPRKQIWIEWDTVCHQPDIWSTATSGENGFLDLTKTSFNLLPPWRSHICKDKHKLQQFVCEEWASVEFIQ